MDGMKDTLRLEAMLERIILEAHSSDEGWRLSRDVLHKLCYLADFDHYEAQGESLSGETYVHTRNGPVPIHFDRAADELVTDLRIDPAGDGLAPSEHQTRELPPWLARGYGEDAESLTGTGALYLDGIAFHDLPEIPDTGKAVIRDVVRRHKGMSARELEAVVKGDTPWILSGEGQAMDYELVFYREGARDDEERRRR